jgi:hypothetical protein
MFDVNLILPGRQDQYHSYKKFQERYRSDICGTISELSISDLYRSDTTECRLFTYLASPISYWYRTDISHLIGAILQHRCVNIIINSSRPIYRKNYVIAWFSANQRAPAGLVASIQINRGRRLQWRCYWKWKTIFETALAGNAYKLFR